MIDQARAVADAVLYEGFLLFPYRRDALKNQLPFQFGVLMPQGYDDPSEPKSLRSQMVLCNAGAEANVEGLIRFLQHAEDPIAREIPFGVDVRERRTETPFEVDILRGRIVTELRRDGEAWILTLEVHNETATSPHVTRNEALQRAFISAHALLTTTGCAFASLLDAPESAIAATARCVNERVFPVLAGEPGAARQTSTTVLVSPIILYDFPSIAKASSGHTFDATEIDELLMLSVASLGEDEKQAARDAHPYVRELVARAESLDADTLATLHGELTGGAPKPGDESVEIGGTIVKPGSHVRVHPKGRADVWDEIIDGMTGRVCAVHTDFEGKRYVGVVFDGDPASDMHEWYGRSFFYGTDEVEPQ